MEPEISSMVVREAVWVACGIIGSLGTLIISGRFNDEKDSRSA